VRRETLLLFLRKELRDLKANRQVWPAYLLLPAIAVLLPVLLLALLPVFLDPALAGHDPGADMLRQTIANDATLAGATLAERLARYLLRELGVFYLLMPVILASTGAALALVREKEQRTLEPILATPLRDRDLLLAKLLASVGPALLVTWSAFVPGVLAGGLCGWWRVGRVILPTAGNLVGVLLLAPAMAAVAALLGLRVSARFTDVPGAMQFTGLLVIPASLILVAVLGRPAMAHPGLGLAGAALLALAASGLFARTVRKFRREELLTRWK
jgi:ABC-type Na+ efflux pump permease subunit